LWSYRHSYYSLVSDQRILEMFRNESSREEAFRILIKQNQKDIYYHVRRMVLDHDDADDLTQNTFIKAWKNLDAFRGDAQISTWLFRIAYNESVTFLERKKKLMNVPMEDVEHKLIGVLQEDELYTGDFMQMQLQTAMAMLPEKQKAVFVMKYYEEKKYEEIAEITGTSVGALKASFHHAIKKIEAYLLNK